MAGAVQVADMTEEEIRRSERIQVLRDLTIGLCFKAEEDIENQEWCQSENKDIYAARFGGMKFRALATAGQIIHQLANLGDPDAIKMVKTRGF